jgi:hypothetical protein
MQYKKEVLLQAAKACAKYPKHYLEAVWFDKPSSKSIKPGSLQDLRMSLAARVVYNHDPEKFCWYMNEMPQDEYERSIFSQGHGLYIKDTAFTVLEADAAAMEELAKLFKNYFGVLRAENIIEAVTAFNDGGLTSLEDSLRSK